MTLPVNFQVGDGEHTDAHNATNTQLNSVTGRVTTLEEAPTDGSVTNAEVAADAAISADKLADGITLKVLTATERSKLAGLATVATSGSASDITTGTLPDSVIPTGIARDSEVTGAVAELRGGAPESLDTLDKLAASIGDDPAFAATTTTALELKAADSAVVHSAGDETVTGVKTFSSAPVVPTSSFPQAAVTGLPAALTAKADLVGGFVPDAQIPAGITRDSELAAAISAVVAGAPGALDTLAELAAALADDANYATTITTALALKAPLASPTFTGTVSGVTKAHVGLGNVDNTADTAKPVSTAQQAAIDAATVVAHISTVAAAGSATTLVAPTAATVHFVTLTATTCAITLPTPVAGTTITVFLRQDATGGRLATWNATAKWPFGVAPTLTAEASGSDEVTFFSPAGVSWFGSHNASYPA